MWSIYLCVEIENGTAFDKIKWTWDSLYWNIWQGTLYDDKFQLGTNWFNFVLCSSPAIFKSTKVILLLSACQSSIMFQPFTVPITLQSSVASQFFIVFHSSVIHDLPEFFQSAIVFQPSTVFQSSKIFQSSTVIQSSWVSQSSTSTVLHSLPLFHSHPEVYNLLIFNSLEVFHNLREVIQFYSLSIVHSLPVCYTFPVFKNLPVFFNFSNWHSLAVYHGHQICYKLLIFQSDHSLPVLRSPLDIF